MVPAHLRPRARRVVRLAVEKVGQATCRHTYALVIFRGRMFLRCSACNRETRGFVVYEPLKGQGDS
ncbi:MAG TPA: hypothetical protein VM364_00805 [Vicinamibacterales bacterium]|nr:hypothetical protein [Vicinamibacterales bacterium]